MNDINREDLVREIENLGKENKILYENARTHTENTLVEFFKEIGVSEIINFNPIKDLEYIYVNVLGDAGEKRDFDIRFAHEYWDDSKKRVLKLNYSTSGSFGTNATLNRNYLKCLGKVVENMDDLEERLLDFNWDDYDAIQSKFHTAKYKLSSYDDEIKRKELEAKKTEILHNLVEGSQVIVGKKRTWENGEIKYTDDVRTIYKVCNKTITIGGFYHRLKKEDVLNHIANNNWTLVEEKSLTTN